MSELQTDHPAINRNIHPPILALIFIGLAILLGWLLPIALPAFVEWIGLGLILIGVVLAFGAFNEFRKAHTTLDPHGSVKALVTQGIYQFTRNPIYLGFLLMVIGFPLNSGSYSGLVVAPFFMVTMNRLVIEKEEAYLEKKFGEAYTGYRSRVRRWF
ncbi:MAG TPA: isoprenylcysteine carboxylmethyltransferase family protein [Anaerolineae bacterium]|nr:isoprenylcysteine carboxylmethyltransferase family protein [Anaerolineae bacterium]HRJ56824.1 isoprenylcysteine carboxylmethyltransferase family protein [Anaerolineales bacterium]